MNSSDAENPASVPSELVDPALIQQWKDEYSRLPFQPQRFTQQDFLLSKAAAYGRRQSDIRIRISADQWAELVARHPETMQVLFGGQS